MPNSVQEAISGNIAASFVVIVSGWPPVICAVGKVKTEEEISFRRGTGGTATHHQDLRDG